MYPCVDLDNMNPYYRYFDTLRQCGVLALRFCYSGILERYADDLGCTKRAVIRLTK